MEIQDYWLRALDFKENYLKKTEETAEILRKASNNFNAKIAIVLGSGLGKLQEHIEAEYTFDYADIPNFEKPKVEGHAGKLIFGKIGNVPIIALSGRKHYYELADEPFQNGILKVVFPVHVLANLGVEVYIASNAAGALNPEYKVGDLMLLSSHISHLPNPLLGKFREFKRVDTDEAIDQFPVMSQAYHYYYRKEFESIAKKHNLKTHTGTYLAATGPTYETEAESLLYRQFYNADVVGMSTAPEIIVARTRGMKTMAFSLVTNEIADSGENLTNHEEVNTVLKAGDLQQKLATVMKEFVIQTFDK